MEGTQNGLHTKGRNEAFSWCDRSQQRTGLFYSQWNFKFLRKPGFLMERYVCIHGHFYQPPRENPWLEDVELQDSAYPFHDWNMRITEECYRQNAASRILGADKKIINIVNNYSNISFNFGPTLLSWLATHEPNVYDSILDADEKSRNVFSGHGSAMAQAYNHIILPLANNRDKHTQVIWGIRYFEQHFKREPEGMWLPETAANTETLEVLAEHHIKFTVLAPHQAHQVRRLAGGQWTEVTEENLDTTMPYLCHLPSGKSIVIFFYNGSIANDVAYGGLLHDGKEFAERLTDSFRDNGHPAQLAHIATDGESFGHHHRYGDMALAYCLHYIRTNHLAKVTVYGEYLEKFPPSDEVRISENTSWSCSHGVERWKNNCGCSYDKSLSGRQPWRQPLRKSMDFLRDKLSDVYEKNLSQYCPDPWQVRNDYIQIINDESDENRINFIEKVTHKELEQQDIVSFLKLTEMQRMSLLMYTSDGWFFDNIYSIEAIQLMLYAARAMQLYKEITGIDLFEDFKAILRDAPTNNPELSDGRDVFNKYINPAGIDLYRVGAHFALMSVFSESPDTEQEIYCYSANLKNYKNIKAGSQTLATGSALIKSHIVQEQASVDFATLHMGGHNLFTALNPPLSTKAFQQMHKDLEKAFYRGDTNEVMRQMNLRFGINYSIWHLFRDVQRRMVYELLRDTWEEVELSFRHIYEENYPIMLMLRSMNMNLPKALAAPAEFILNQELCQVIEAEDMDINRLKEYTEEVKRLSLQLDKETIRYEASAKINNLMERFEQSRGDIKLLSTIESALKILIGIVPDMDLQSAQNLFFTVAKEKYPEMKTKASTKQENAARWIELFELIAEHLGLVVE
jgi:alpha-amylase/alpha-mannosidase (GH57 family)